MTKINSNRSLIAGFITGVLLMLAGWWGVTSFGKAQGGREIAAEMGGEKLTFAQLREKVAELLIPIENDKYALFNEAIENWLDEQALQKEAKTLGVPLEKIYDEEVWSRVRVGLNEALNEYNRNRELYNQPFEKIQPDLLKSLRERAYADEKGKYLNELREKYRARNLLPKPKSFVKGLALPALKVSPGPSPGASAVSAPARPAAAPPAPKVKEHGGTVLPTRAAPLFNDLEGRPSRGPTDAPITIVEFSDFYCPFCQRAQPTIAQLMQNYPGKIRRIWRHYPLSFHQGADRVHEASECAHEQGRFWDFHGKVFENQQAARGDEALIGIAKQIGLDEDRFTQCLQIGKYKALVQQEITKGNQVGVSGTPTFFLNDQLISGAQPYTNFERAVESILNPGKVQPLPSRPVAREHGGAPLPAQAVVQFDDLEGRPSRGPKDAPVTIVEFSDFYCPFCQRAQPTMDQLMQNYEGKIRRVWRHYPLPFHQGADRVHEASECAQEQGKFWEFHGKVFENPQAARGDEALVGLAKQVGLNEKRFRACLESDKYKDLIQKEIAMGSQSGVSGTPTFFINGRLLSGAQPYDSFESVVRSELQEKQGA